MYSSSEFERLFIRYKAEAMPHGESIQNFCLKNKVPYNLFHNSLCDTSKLDAYILNRDDYYVHLHYRFKYGFMSTITIDTL